MKTENSIIALVKAMNKKNDAERVSKVQELTVQLDLLEEDILEERRYSSTIYCGWGTQHGQLMEELNEAKDGSYEWDEVKEEIVWTV